MLKDMSLLGFLDQTASNEPVPGGGSIAALSGAVASALSQMVANLTIGKKKYVEVEAEMLEIAAKMKEYQNMFVDFIDEDAASFDDVMKAFKLPKETDEDKAARTAAIQTGMKKAAEVPLNVAQTCTELMPLIEVIVQKGNQNAVTDGAVASMMCRTAALSALLNVRINLGSIKDEAYVADMNEKCHKVESYVREYEDKILNQVEL